MKKEEQKKKLLRLEQLVDADCANGRHLQKKIKAKLIKMGLKEQEFMEEVSNLKAKG